MPRQPLNRPTDGELAILRVLWDQGPSTVRDVHDALKDTQKTGYTTVLKMMQIMTEKGLLVRDESKRTQVYRPRRPRSDTQRRIVRDVIDRAFGGSTQELVLRALSEKRATPEELAKIRKMLDQLE